jgi:integrase
MKVYKRCDCPEPLRCRHRFWFKFKLRGRQYRGTTRTANRQLADQIAGKRRLEVLEAREGWRPPKPVKLSEHVKAYVAHTAKTNRSSYKDQAVLDRLIASVGDRSTADVSPFHIERWKRERADQVSQSTVNRELNIVRGCFSRAVEWGRLGVSPLRTVKPYRVDDVRLRVCSPEDIKTLLDGAPSDLRLIARLTLESLLRLSEAVSLRREDIGPTFATIVRSKTGRARRVPLTAELRADLLARYSQASGFVFGLGKSGKPPNPAAISVAFSRLTAALGLTGVSHHTLRHTGATVMVANGVSLRAVQTIGGWSSLRMVERYAHVDDAELARAVRVTRNHTEEAIRGGTKRGTEAHVAAGKSDPKTKAKV